jgi:uncharacterized membrane protein SirB2
MRKHRAHRLPVRLSPRHEWTIYMASTLLFVSGVAWLVIHFFRPTDSLPSPSEPWWLRVHGAAMLLFLIVLGSLFPTHVLPGWRHRTNHRSGIFVLTVVIILTLTGYGLYYLGDETIRPWISAVHWGIGLVAAGGLAVHAFLGKRASAINSSKE